MDEGLKKRLIGATVLVSLVVIFVPMLLEKEPIVSTELEENIIPEKPQGDFASKLLPLETEALSKSPMEEPVPLQDSTSATQDEEVAESTPKAEARVEPEPAASKKEESAPMVGLSGWVIQVGSFSQRDNAEKLVKELQAKKYAAFTDQVDVKGNILHRVLVGPEVDKKRAEQMLADLNKILEPKKLSGKIKRYQ